MCPCDGNKVTVGQTAHMCILMRLYMYRRMCVAFSLVRSDRGRIFGAAFRSLWAHHMPVAAQ